MGFWHRIRARSAHFRAVAKPSTYRNSELFLAPDNFFDLSPDRALEQELSRLFAEHGSDKSTNHDYHRIYQWILANVPSGPAVEIGLGSNNLDVPSNMGADGVPGASLRGWRETGIFTTVWGADVDRRVLFSEPGIETRFVDQLDSASLEELAQELQLNFPEGVALLIDDGLHTAEANTNTVRALWPTVREGGYMCVEDLEIADLHRVLNFAIRHLSDAEWGLWSNINRGGDNQLLILRKASPHGRISRQR